MGTKISNHQWKAINELKNGSVLCGGVGSGKSRTALLYYGLKVCKGKFPIHGINERNIEKYERMKQPRDLFIITTAKKRDSLEWDKEISDICFHEEDNKINITIDSWNNIKKYTKIYGAFFIFDEQRVVGKGSWVKSFLNITRKNQWILLSATPGDQWIDYVPIFIANGFYMNRRDFENQHCMFSRFSKYPKIERYVNIKKLKSLRQQVLIYMDDNRITERHEIYLDASYDPQLYKMVAVKYWDPYEDKPIKESGKYMQLLRKVVNTHPDRIKIIDEIIGSKKKVIIFYNFDYELKILKDYLDSIFYTYAEYNGHKHEDCPEGDAWAYLVQYTAGCEGWNCITTDSMIFYSQNYSYRITEQAMGRIDRVNTLYRDLYYFKIISKSPIDKAIHLKLKNKKNFNERDFFKFA